MGQVIDENVAVLRFDNKSFEANVRTSLGTLEKLKQALQFNGLDKGFSQIDAASGKVTFSKLYDSVGRIESRFSTFGIAGMTVIQDITRSLENLVSGAFRSAEQAVGFVFDKIYTGGKNRALNIEQAKFLLDGLLDDEAKVTQILEQAKESVADTAFGLDQAALAASNLVASGVEAGDSLEKALSGIAGIAATTNSDYSRIAEIFSQISGYGKVMSNDFLQLSTRGLNGAAILADYFNEVKDGSIEASDAVKEVVNKVATGAKVTEADIRDLTRKGLISFEMFSNAMSEKFGAHAKDANKTLTGVLSNVNARFSQIGAKFIEPLVEQEGPLVSFFNKVKDKLAEVRDGVDLFAKLFDDTVIKVLDVAGTYLDKIDITGFLNKFDSFLNPPVGKEAIEQLGLSEDGLKSFQNTLSQVAKEHNIDLDKMMGAEKSFWDTLDEGWLSTNLLTEAIKKLTGAEKESTKQTGETVDKLKELAKLVINGEYGGGEERFAALTELGVDPQKVQDLVNKIYELAGGTWEYDEATVQAAVDALGLSDELDNNSEVADKDKEALRKLQKSVEENQTPFDTLSGIIGNLHSVFESLLGIVSDVTDAMGIGFKDVFGDLFPKDMDEAGKDFIKGLENVNNFLISFKIDESRFDQIKRIFRGIFSIASIVVKGVSDIFGGVLPAFYKDGEKGADTLIETLASIGDKIYEFSKNFEVSQDTIDKITRVLKGVLAFGSIVFNFLSALVENGLGPFSGVLATVFEFILDKAALLGDIIVDLNNKISESDAFQTGIKKVVDFFSNLSVPQGLIDFFNGIRDAIKDAGDKIRNSGISGVLEAISNAVEKFINSVRNTDTSSAASVLSTIANAVGDFINRFINFDTIAALVSMALIMKLLAYVMTFIYKLVTLPAKLINIASSVSGLLTNLSVMFKKIGRFFTKLGIASLIFAIAAAFLMIVKALSMLNQLDESKLKQTIVMTFLVAGVIIGIYSAITAMDQKAHMSPSLGSIAFIIVTALAFGKIAKALAKLEGLSAGQMVAGVLAIGGAIFVMTKLAEELSALKTQLDISVLAFPILYAMGLQRIAKALVTISDVPGDQLFVSMVVLLGSLAIMAEIAKQLSALKLTLDISALAFPILYAKGLKDIAQALATVSELPADTLFSGMIALLFSLYIMSELANRLSQLGTKLDVSALAFPIAYAMGLKDIAKALATISDIRADTLFTGMIALLGSLFIMAYIAEKLSDMKAKLSLSALVFPIAYAMGLKGIAKALATISDIPRDQLVVGLVVLLGSLIIMAAIAEILSGLETKLSLTALIFPIAYAMGLKGIAKALTALKDLTTDQITVGIVALLGSLIIMAAIAEILSGLETKLSLTALVFPIAYAMGLKGIAKALATLKDLTQDQMVIGMVVLLGALIIMAAIAELLSGLETKLSLSALAFPIAYANALNTIAKSLVMLKDFTGDQLATSLFYLLGAIIIMAAVAEALSKLESKVSLSALVFPIAMAAALLIAALAIRVVGSMASEDLMQGVQALAVVIILLGAVITVMGGFVAPLRSIAEVLMTFAIDGVIIAAGFAILSVGFMFLAMGFKAMADVDIETVIAGLIGLAGAMVIFGVAIAVISTLSVGGVFIILVASGLLILSIAAYVLAEALVKLSTIFHSTTDEAANSGQALHGAVSNALSSLLNFIISIAPYFLAAGAVIFAMLVLGVTGAPLLLLAGLGLLIATAVTYVRENGVPNFLKAGANLIKGFIVGIASLLPNALNTVGNFFNFIKDKVLGVLEEKSPSKFTEQAGNWFIDGFTGGVESKSGEASDAATSAAEDSKNSFLTELLGDEELFDGGEEGMNQVLEGLMSKSPELEEGSSGMGEDAKNAFLTEYLSGNELFDGGAEGAGQLTEGMLSGSEDLNGAINELISGGETDVSSFINNGMLEQDGRDFNENIATGISTSSDRVSHAATSVSDEARREVDRTKSDWVDVGEHLAEGLGQGIKNKNSYVSGIAEKIIENANNKAKQKAKVNSPSKVWMALGNSLDEGLIKGMIAMGSEVNYTAERVIENVTLAAKKPMDDLSELMSSGIVDSPVITPVFDFSEIQNGADRLYSMIDEAERISFNGNVELASNAALSISNDRDRKTKNDNQMIDKLVDAISVLSELIGHTGNVYNVNGITYDDGSNVSAAINMLIRAAKVGGRA